MNYNQLFETYYFCVYLWKYIDVGVIRGGIKNCVYLTNILNWITI